MTALGLRLNLRHASAARSIMPTILIIDDNDAVQTALDVLLSLQGHRVVTASTPAEGLRTVASVDLVIQDMNFRKEATSGEEGIALFLSLIHI